MRPLGVPRGRPSGSARNCLNSTRSSSTPGTSMKPAAQKSSNGRHRPAVGRDPSAPAVVEVPKPRHLVRPSVKRGATPRLAARSEKIAKSLRASPHGATARRIAIRHASFGEPPMSFRSSVIDAGSTMSAWRAIGVQNALVDDDRLRPGERLAQPPEVLVVMERVAAAPVHEADLGIGEPAAIEVERLARMEQHVRQPGEGDERADAVLSLRQRRRPHAQGRPADVPERTIALAESAARQADLAEHRRQRHREPSGPARRARRAGASSSR